jgi:hypothetical protein
MGLEVFFDGPKPCPGYNVAGEGPSWFDEIYGVDHAMGMQVIGYNATRE